MLAVDPTSPFSGGAILGDRVRMQSHTTDPGVFIRSMATRGHLGGLALATPQAVRVLDAVGKAWIVIETVGVGQVEVEIAGHADTTVVVVNPGMGRRGADREGGPARDRRRVRGEQGRPARRRRDGERPRGMLELAAARSWTPPIVRTVATTGEGVDELFDAIVKHRAHLESTGEDATRRDARLREELRGLVAARMEEHADATCRGPEFDAIVAQVEARTLDPYAAVDALLRA